MSEKKDHHTCVTNNIFATTVTRKSIIPRFYRSILVLDENITTWFKNKLIIVILCYSGIESGVA